MLKMDHKTLMSMKVASFDAGIREILKSFVKQGYGIQNIKPINKNRYAIVKFFNRSSILIMYKRELFQSFGTMLKHEGAKGIGDSTNANDLRIAIANDVKDIFTIFPDGRVYTIKMNDFLKDSYAWINKEGKRVRSISVHKYKRFENGIE